MHDNHQQYSHPDVSSTALGFAIALAMPVQAPPRLTDAVYGNGWKIGSFWPIYFRPFHPEHDLQFGRQISHCKPSSCAFQLSVVLLGLENKPCWCRFLHAGWGRRSLSHAPVHQWIRSEGQQHQAPERTTKSSNQFRTLVSFHCFPTRQLTGTGATLANTCSHKAAPNVSAPDANAYGARRPRSTCQKRHKQLISDDMLKHEAEHKQLFRTAGVQNKNKTHNNVLVDVISCQITASTVAFKLKN
ncbi:hypothetical protein T12_8582 [Trichinella patagoniensis]|uniref:Uncharacterized protein n=1 Tax=Trichinella patagoniensis TaxID=990121 RepID=A0A0V1A6Y8_9BILA|nr:hypothetical protein T12_8582 [Trichinella patagoniensis]